MEKKLEELFQPVMERHAITKSKISYLPGKVGTLEVMIARADGSMDMDTCAEVSRELSALLDQIDYGSGAYNLDVCSFGAERELETEQEINSSIGEYVHVDFVNPKDGMDQLEGELVHVTEDALTIQYLIKGRKKTGTVERENVRLIRLAVRL